MSRWRDVIDLISVDPDGVDGEGYPLPVETTRTGIFANKKSATSAEFYRASQAGFTVDRVFVVRDADYDGEKLIQHEGDRYEVLRTYEKGENVELYCTTRGDTHGD